MNIKFFFQKFKTISRFLALFFLFISLLSGLLLVWPSYKHIKFLKQEILKQKNILNSQKTNLEAIYKFRETLQKINFNTEKINQILPNNENIPGFLILLENSAIENGVIFKSINFSAQSQNLEKLQDSDDSIGITSEPSIEPSISYKTTSIDISLEASYKNLVKYLSAIEDNLRIMDVENISIKNSEIDQYLMNLKINVYHR